MHLTKPASGLILGLVLILACSEGPEDSVRSLGNAFRDQDRLALARYMDVDRTASSLTSALMTEVTRQSDRDSVESGSDFGGMLGTAMMGAMQPAITAYVRGMIHYMVDSSQAMPSFMGESAGKPTSRAELRDSLANLDLEVRPGRTDGDIALVPVFLPATPNQPDTGTVELRLERAGKNWRVVGVERLPDKVLSVVNTRVR